MNDIILIIGASSSIGQEVIRRISSENNIILAHYNNGLSKITSLQKEVRGQIIPIKADLTIEAEIEALIKSVSSFCQNPNKIVFLAAPSFTLTRFKDLTPTDFKLQIDVQLNSTLRILKFFLPKMAAEKKGNIVFMLSSYTSGIPPLAMSHYITAKYALLGLMKSLASEFASKKICINSVSPSMIETPFLSLIPEKIVEINADQNPHKRNGLPGDVAPVIEFLLSKNAAFMTGVDIPVTGGS